MTDSTSPAPPPADGGAMEATDPLGRTATGVTCGDTAFDPASERRVRAMRAAGGQSPFGGCERWMGFLHAYRCLECGRWMHADCLRAHFAEHGDRASAAAAEVARLRAALGRIAEGDWLLPSTAREMARAALAGGGPSAAGDEARGVG